MMLVFGGKTYVHDYVPNDGTYSPGVKESDYLIYHACEDTTIMPKQLKTDYRILRSCLEETVNELWRYDTVIKQWQFMKTSTSQSETSSANVGWPTARYGAVSESSISASSLEIPSSVLNRVCLPYGLCAVDFHPSP